MLSQPKHLRQNEIGTKSEHGVSADARIVRTELSNHVERTSVTRQLDYLDPPELPTIASRIPFYRCKKQICKPNAKMLYVFEIRV